MGMDSTTPRPLAVVTGASSGIGAGGAFATDTALSEELRLIDLNVRGTVHLAKHVVRDMAARNEGRILITSSIASTMPGAFQAVYNASKSFVQSFGRAGMTDTRIGASDQMDDAANVAKDGFEALMAGDERVESASLSTKLQGRGSRLLPDSAKAQMHRKMAEPGSGD